MFLVLPLAVIRSGVNFVSTEPDLIEFKFEFCDTRTSFSLFTSCIISGAILFVLINYGVIVCLV